MAASNNSKPANKTMAPVVVHRDERDNTVSILRLIPAAFLSGLFHALLIGLMFIVSSPTQAEPPTERANNEVPIQTEAPPEPERSDPFLTSDIDPAATEVDTDIQYNVERQAEVSVPGLVNAMEVVGIEGAAKEAPPTNLPPPGGFGAKGQGGSIDANIAGAGLSMSTGMLGGYGPKGVPLAGSFHGRSGATREFALRDGGGTGESEAAVTRGLQWIARNQHPEGKWQLDGNYTDRGQSNDIAGTAFGLLPLLAAGKTHKAAKDNPYDKPIEKALAFLIRRQDRRTGNLGGGMYAHGIATIALCEAYGLTQDPNLRKPAQMAVNYIVQAQHSGGGWRYAPGQAGDTSVVGWQVMALKSAQMSSLDVPEATMRKAIQYLDGCANPTNEGYGYVGNASTPTMSAVGLLCRQYLQAWGPQNIRMIKGIDNNLKTVPPGRIRNMYYYYYATQVMHHFGGQAWKEWNEKMREDCIAKQIKNGPDSGSWDSRGDAHGGAGGRLMETSLRLLTLEVYYRHLPLYYRDAGQMANNNNPISSK